MPEKSGGSVSDALQARFGNRLQQAHERHKNDEMKVNDFSNLPPGIADGVAQLSACGFRRIPEGREMAGEYEFWGEGVMKAPIEHTYEDPPNSGQVRTVKVFGKQTRYREVLADTPNAQGKKKTFDDHYGSILNEMRKLGYNTSGLHARDLEAAAAAITQAKPYFKVRTSLLRAMEGQQPRVWESWDGPVDIDWEQPKVDADVDNTVAKPSSHNRAQPLHKKAQSMNGTTAVDAAPAAFNEFSEDDLRALEKTASGGDDNDKEVNEARELLESMALEAGRTKEEVEQSDSWSEVVGWIMESRGGSAPPSEDAQANEDAPPSEDAPANETVVPKKGEIWRARLPDSKGNKAKTFTNVEVTAVSTAKSTVDVKALDKSKRVVKGLPFDDLSEAY